MFEGGYTILKLLSLIYPPDMEQQKAVVQEPMLTESDYRPSAQAVGSIEVLIVLAAFLLIFAGDIRRIFRDIRGAYNIVKLYVRRRLA